MKNISSIIIGADGPISLDLAPHEDGNNYAILKIIDSNRNWDAVSFFVPLSEMGALQEGVMAFNRAYVREKNWIS